MRSFIIIFFLCLLPSILFEIQSSIQNQNLSIEGLIVRITSSLVDLFI